MTIENAQRLATLAHEGQTRKYNGEPYITHPIRVAHLVAISEGLEHLDRNKMVQAAFLHDVLEDCPHITEDMIVEATNRQVLDLVKELTNPSKGSKLPRAERKAIDREHLQHVSVEAKILKLIDRYDDLTEMVSDIQTSEDAKRFGKLYAKESELLLFAIHDADSDWATSLLVVIAKVHLATVGQFL